MRKKDLYRAIAKLAIANEQLDDYETSLIAEIDSLRKVIIELTAENDLLKNDHWEAQAELGNKPVESVYPDNLTISKSADGYIKIESQKAYVYDGPNPSLRSVDNVDDLPEM